MITTPEGQAQEAVGDANRRSGASWRLVGRFDGGVQSGAWLLESADGRRFVLKLAQTADWARQVLRAERAVGIARSAGYPTPCWLATGITDSGIGYQVQELVPGRTRERIGIAEARVLIDVLELQADLDPDPERSWSNFLAAELSSGLAGLRAAAGSAGPAGAELLAGCDRLLASADHLVLPRADMVHGDFRPANILFEQDRVTGVIDIEAIGSGTRVFDYATLLDHEELDHDAFTLLVAAATEIAGPDVLRACFAQVALDLVRFMSRNVGPGSEAQLTARIRKLRDRAAELDRLTSG